MNEQRPTPPPPEWFNRAAISPPMSQKPRRRRRGIIIILIALLLIGGAVLAFFMTRNGGSPSSSSSQSSSDQDATSEVCFDQTQYNRLINVINDSADESLVATDVIADEPLYMHEVYFLPDSTEFNLDIADSPIAFLEAIAKYHKANHTSVPFIIEIAPYYSDAAETDMTNRQIYAVRQILIKAGFDEKAIKLVAPPELPDAEGITLEEAEEMEEITDFDIDGIPVSVSIIPTPQKTCQ